MLRGSKGWMEMGKLMGKAVVVRAVKAEARAIEVRMVASCCYVMLRFGVGVGARDR